MVTQLSWRAFKRLLLLFWAVWLTLVVTTNITNALQALGLLPASFLFSSGNYQQIQAVTAPFGLPAAVAGAMFAGVIVW
ncbi:MAG: hypothetical protein K8T89_20165, partial [Planctomycetes bacterium]|nr:hypothetical protein [Planctomycetota bacterium]